jgi:hypothetical protein
MPTDDPVQHFSSTPCQSQILPAILLRLEQRLPCWHFPQLFHAQVKDRLWCAQSISLPFSIGLQQVALFDSLGQVSGDRDTNFDVQTWN